MTLEQKVLLDLLRTDHDGELSKHLGAFDMHIVLEEAKKQSVFLMVMDKAAKIPELLPEEEFKSEYEFAFLRTLKNAEVLAAQQNLVNLLNDNGFSYAIIKGEAASANYPRPELRTLGDVDFLINPKDQDKITELLIAKGFTKKEEDHICHVVFKKPKSHLEMHFEIVGIPNGKPGETVRQYMKNALENTELKNNGAGEFAVLEPAKNGLVLILHMAHHMLTEGIGLRHLADWGFFNNKTKGEAFWDKELIPVLKEIGLLEYAKIMTKTAALYLGTYCPDFAKEVGKELAEEVIEDILTGGNFGRKDEVYSTSGTMVSNHAKDGVRKGKLGNVLAVLKETVYYHYPITKKVKILYPFFAIYKLLRYFFLMLMGKRPSIAKTLPTATKRRDLYSKMKVFEVEE